MDGVQRFQAVDTSVVHLVEKVAVKDGWAYIETQPLEGPGSDEPRAYLLRHNSAAGWVVKWNGPTGAEAGNPTGATTRSPGTFSSVDQDILRCQTVCSATG